MTEHLTEKEKTADTSEYSVNIDILDGLEFGGCSKKIFTIREGHSIRVDAKKHHAIFYHVKKGRIWVEIDGHLPLLVEQGSILVLNRWHAHAIHTAPGPQAGAYYDTPIALTYEAAERIASGSEPGAGALLLFSSEASVGNSPFRALTPYVLHIGQEQVDSLPRFKEILELYQRPSGSDPLQSMMDCKLDELVATILLSYGMQELHSASDTNTRLDDQRIRNLLLKMHEHLAGDWSLSRLSELANLSRSSLIDRFKVAVGETPMNYLTRIRMERAANMLTKEALPISAISYRVGYNSEAAFHRAFKKIFREAPGDYRRRQRNAGGRLH